VPEFPREIIFRANTTSARRGGCPPCCSKTTRPYVPMALTLFPTEICLKFASVPGPEAHKYVIPPISCGSVTLPLPLPPPHFLPPLAPAVPSSPSSSSSLSSSSLSSLLVTLATPYVFLRGCTLAAIYKGKRGKSFVPKENTMQYPGRPVRDATIRVPLSLSRSSFLSSFSTDVCSPSLHLFLSCSPSLVLFFEGIVESHKSVLILLKIL